MVEEVNPAVEALTWALCAAAGGGGPGKCDPEHCGCRGETRAVKVALTMSGWKIVPKLPSLDMLVRGDEAILEELNDSFALKDETPALKCWRAMVANT